MSWILDNFIEPIDYAEKLIKQSKSIFPNNEKIMEVLNSLTKTGILHKRKELIILRYKNLFSKQEKY